MENKNLSIRDEPNIRLRRSRNVKNTCFTDENTSPFVPAQRAHMFQHECAWCRYTWGRFERTHGDVFSGHWVFSVSHAHTTTTTTHTTQHNNTTTTPHGDRDRDRQRQTETDRDRERRQGQRERREDGRGETRREKRRQKEDKTRQDKKRREKIHFAVWWCMAFFVGVVIFLLIPSAHET